MWFSVKFIQNLGILLMVMFDKDKLIKSSFIWLKYNWLKILVAVIAGIITYELLDWIYLQRL